MAHQTGRKKLWLLWAGLAVAGAAAGVALALSLFYYTLPRPQIGLIKIAPSVVLDEQSVAAISEMLAFALQREDIKGVAVVVDSPGGGVSASEEVLLSMLRLREKKPVVISQGSIAASGGYLISLGANYIYAKAASLTGNIGVIVQAGQPELPFEDLITSGPFKETGLPYQGWVQAIEILKENFVEAVIAQRGDRLRLTREEVGDGRIYLGVQALEAGLVDDIGSAQDAIAKAAQLAGVKRYRVLDINKETGHERFQGFFFLLRQSSPYTRLYYLYVEPTR